MASDKLRIACTVREAREAIAAARAANQRIGLIPTMGYLHDGHVSLIDLCKNHADYLVVSVFVNPTQFSPHEDLSRYPRDFERDRHLIEAQGAHLLFAPTTKEIYPEDSQIRYEIRVLADHLCGPKRPGHFEGVLLVVSKLFHIIQPDVAVFGQKDLQQLLIIQRMITDLNFPIQLIAGPTIREPNGLAMSSRNSYLTTGERRESATIYRALQEARQLIESGERSASIVIEALMKRISKVQGSRMDYIGIVDLARLQPVEQIQGRIAIALAVYIGQTRLIDNMILEVNHGKVQEIPAFH
ncbi:MAG: pantoate--beta-alanine ligase [Candidatus Fraserbacteria bacterium RBG_16_55_9]|uniref:Pantothenate synthetase n=1 Tax=Fraserbacteria sp. (strain RBG_16_55_9) TaxID=1817864 RepID=A0A1F5UNR9_FRAXR|nr:MAG: pantoate--beta-alanine ligase [Candidatus Fraserbacteria bacterium RBG_16_55_9]